MRLPPATRPSWPAAYNLACVYAAIYADRNHQPDAGQIENELQCLVEKVVTSLEFAINNPECEMERPSEWIASDPDFGCLRSRHDHCSKDRNACYRLAVGGLGWCYAVSSMMRWSR